MNLILRPRFFTCLVVAACFVLSGTIAQADVVALYLFDEGSGTLAGDSSNYGNDGALKGYLWDTGLGHTDWNDDPASAPAWVAGVRGGALSFTHANAASPYVNMAVEISHDASLSLGSTFTVTFWANPSTDTALNSYSRILYKPGSYYVQTDNQPGDNDLYVWNDNGITGVNAGVTGPMTLGAWHHYAIVWNNPTLTLYIDGIQADQVTGSNDPSASGSPLLIGRDTGGGQDFYGLLDEVAVFNEALDGGDVALAMSGDFSSFLGGGPPMPPAGEIVGLWQFDEGSGTTTADATIYANDGTLNGYSGPEDAGVQDVTALPTWTTGVYGGALQFTPDLTNPGKDAVVEIPEDDVHDLVDRFTYMCWANPTGDGGGGPLCTYGYLFQKQGAYYFQLDNAPGDNDLYVWNDDGFAGINTGVTGPSIPDAWHHYTFTFDDGTLTLYIDGVQADQVTGITGRPTIATGARGIIIGRDRFRNASDYHGAMDDVALFDYALDGTEIATAMSGDFSPWLLAQLPTDGTETLTVGEGDDICLTVPYPGTATSGDFTWTFTPAGGGAPQVLSGETDVSLCLTDLQAATHTVTLNVVPGMPLGSLLGLGAIAAGLAAAGAQMLRRKK